MGTELTGEQHDLVERAHTGDIEAIDALIDRHLHPAWRVASVSANAADVAEAAVIAGFCDSLAAARGEPDPDVSLRERIVSATRRAAIRDVASTPGWPSGNAIVEAFRSLPEKGRTALWLMQVEGGTAEQAAAVLGVEPAAAAGLAERAAARLHERLAPAARAPESIPYALREMVDSPPSTLAPAISERWTKLLERERRRKLAPFSDRVVGGAAAAVFLLGLVGAAVLSGENASSEGPRLAAPVAAEAVDAATGQAALGSSVPFLAGSTVPRSYIPASVRPAAFFTRLPTSTPVRAVDRVATLGSTVPGSAVTRLPAALNGGSSTQTPTTTTTPGSNMPVTPPTTPPSAPPALPAPPLPPLPPLEIPVPPLPAPVPVPPVDVQVPGVGGVTAGECTGVAVPTITLGCPPPSATSP